MSDTNVNLIINRVKQHFFAGEFSDVENVLTTALLQHNNNQQILYWLCQFYTQMRRFSSLIELFNVNKVPENCLNFHIGALRALKRHEVAITLLEELSDASPERQLLLATLYKEQGAKTQAIELLSQLIDTYPETIEAYWQLCQLTPELTTQQHQTLTLFVQQDEHPLRERALACYTLASVFDQAGDHARAFDYYAQGAKLKRRSFGNYQFDAELHELDNLAHAFHLAKSSTQPLDTQSQPIFIVGMPRSGTTLVEQIIASHSQVVGADELSDLMMATQQLLRKEKPASPYPHWADQLSSKAYSEIALNYYELTKPFQTKRYFTDKMPLNFKAIGIIKRAFPNAKIIHCKRNAHDTIWGNFRQLFGEGIRFSYNLNELTRYYLAYDKLMTHWHSLYPEAILTIDYEALVDDIEAQTARLCEYLELDFEVDCLAFFKSNRVVHTLSSQQVRQPIFKSGVGRWKNYEFAFGEVNALLDKDE